MSITTDITLRNIYTAVGNFLQGIAGIDPNTSVLVPVVVGQPNRVTFPPVPFMLMQGFVSGRLSTNIHRSDFGAQTTATEKKTKARIQVDFYGPKSHDWADTVETLWRDPYGCRVLAPTCAPLYNHDAFQGALISGEEQYEDRWTIELFLQYNPVTIISQDSATALAVTVINVDERYPP